MPNQLGDALYMISPQYILSRKEQVNQPRIDNNFPPDSFGRPGLLTAGFNCVDTEEIEDLSESLPPPIETISPEAVESDLFFLGIGGRTFPGSSVRRCL